MRMHTCTTEQHLTHTAATLGAVAEMLARLEEEVGAVIPAGERFDRIEAGSPYLNRPRRSEAEARRDLGL